MTFSSIYIKIPFPLNQHCSCFTIIEPHFTVSDFIQKTLNQIYPTFNLNPDEYGIYVLPQNKWLFPKCMLSDYIEYVSPLKIEHFQLRPKKLVSITVTCLQYKSTILCDPNQPVSMLAKRAADIFLQYEIYSDSILFHNSSRKVIRTSQSHNQNITLDSTQFSTFISATENEKFFDWDSWSIWFKHRFIPEDTPCSILHLYEVHMRRETKIQQNSPNTLFRTSLREQILREINNEKKGKKEKREHRKERKEKKDNSENSSEIQPSEDLVEVVKIKAPHTSPLGAKSLAPLHLSLVLPHTQKVIRNKSPRSPRSSRSGNSSHSSRHDDDDILDSFFDKIEDQIPIFLELLFQKIESNPKDEGIFRKSGLQVTIDSIIEKVDAMFSQSSIYNSAFKEELKNFIEAQQIHDIVGVLKSYFRVLPENLIPRIFNDLLLEAASIKEPEERIPIYKCIISSMPASNYAALKRLSKCLNIVSNYSDENKMNLMNLVICIFPALVKTKASLDQLALIAQSKIQSLIGYDIFEKKRAKFTYSRKPRKNFEIQSNIAKCIKKVDNDFITVGNNYTILKDDVPDILTIFIDNNRQADVPLNYFERQPPFKLLPFTDWKILSPNDDVEFQYLPITSSSVPLGVNNEINYQHDKLKSASEKLEKDIQELTDILASLSKNEEVNKDDVKKKLQEMSLIDDYMY